MLLAVDTATRQAGLALYDGEMVRAETTWHAGRYHTEWLAPAIHDALRRLRATMKDLSAVAVTIGPGSFTGLRVAMSLAKGIAAARNLPIIGIPTLDVTAYSHVEAGVALCATLAAGRGRHAYGFYTAQSTRTDIKSTPLAVAHMADLTQTIKNYQSEENLWIIGEFGSAERQYLRDHLPIPERVRLLPPALSVRRPAALAELAWPRFVKGQVDDLHTLEPIYLSLVGKAK
ncbi:MAG: tRNA (adenosine(37)-N6)-threonylcarbamoyltransferase complex dimerization subunit type 1 TsaB, partial [Ardenticatenaceae bacterium]